MKNIPLIKSKFRSKIQNMSQFTFSRKSHLCHQFKHTKKNLKNKFTAKKKHLIHFYFLKLGTFCKKGDEDAP